MEWTRFCVLTLCVVLHACTCSAVTREFYIACVEEEWDYAPGGSDSTVVSGYGQTSYAPVYLNRSSNRIGHKYKKVLYKEYSDSTFTFLKPKPLWLGFVGPILAAENGDTVVVHFKNMANRSYSFHPHGLNYNKSSEGATNGTGGSGIGVVQPGQNYTYSWAVSAESSPSEGDPDCISWLYHSHVSPVKDVASGLVGFLLTCRRGRLPSWELTRKYALYVAVVDENLSWYLDENINLFTDNNVDKDDEDFQESNKMHAINGYVYGHLAGLSACVGETIHWHMASLGTEVDVHAIAVSGHSFEYFNHRKASIPLVVATTATASMVAFTKGKWSLHCTVDDHLRAGMEAFLTIDNCWEHARPEVEIVRTRRYYISAEEERWDYAPSGRNRYDGGELTEEGSVSEMYFKSDSFHIGGVYKKALFREYTDFRFRERKVRAQAEKHLGFLGPVIRAEVGDQIKVVFYNKASRPFSLHAHGVQFSKYNEGYLNNDGYEERMRGDDMVSPGRIHTYYWNVPEEMGPSEDDPPCLTRIYTSGVDVIKDTHSGLVGPLLICRQGALDSDGRQDYKEMFLLLSSTDENKSWYLEDNIEASTVDPDIDQHDTHFMQSNVMHGINGRLFGNLEGVSMCAGGVVSLHVFSVGGVDDAHTLTLSETLQEGSSHKVTSGLLPGSMSTFTLVPQNTGSWGFFCGQFEHFTAGAKAIYTVTPCTGSVVEEPLEGGDVVRVFLQAELEYWDYLSDKDDRIDRAAIDREAPTEYVKALFKAYTDESFNRQTTRELYLGFLGPIIRVEVGDVLEIVFKNSVVGRNFSISAHGLVFNSPDVVSSEPSVGPGDKITYSWNVTRSSGPGTGDGACVTRVYYSSVDYVRDVNSGLIGPLIVCKKGELRRQGNIKERTSVDHDLVGYFAAVDENKSWFLEQSVIRSYGNVSAVNFTHQDFVNSNKIYSINGFIFGNKNNYPTVRKGDNLEWYLINMGTEIHSIHFHGNDITAFGDKPHTADAVPLLAMETSTVRMSAINEGLWMYHCHVDEHYNEGMRALYKVRGRLRRRPRN